MAHRQGSPNRQGKRSCCTLPTPCLARARSLFLRTLAATPCPTHSPQRGSHCPSPLLCFLGKQGLYMTTTVSVCVRLCLCTDPRVFVLAHSHYTKVWQRAGESKFLQVLTSFAKRQRSDSIVILAEGEAGICDPRERGESQKIPQPWEKFQLRLTTTGHKFLGE